MPQNSETLATLIGSRMCHDLISPIGAIQNGLELMAMAGTADTSAEMELIQDSCTSAAARIRFFRVAFGLAADAQKMSPRECTATLDGLCKGTRMTASWLPKDDMRRTEVQLAFLAHLCCESAMPKGGAVQFEHSVSGWLITAKAPRLTIISNQWDHLNGTAELLELAPNRVHFALLPVLAADRGHKLLATATETKLSISII